MGNPNEMLVEPEVANAIGHNKHPALRANLLWCALARPTYRRSNFRHVLSWNPATTMLAVRTRTGARSSQ